MCAAPDKYFWQQNLQCTIKTSIIERKRSQFCKYILKTVKPPKFVGVLVRHCLDISLCAVTSIWRTKAWVCKICSGSKVQFNQLQRIWDDLAPRVWHSGRLQSSSSLSFFLLWWCPLLKCSLQGNCPRNRLLLGLLMLITGVTGDRGAESHTQSGQKSSLQHNCSWSRQTYSKSTTDASSEQHVRTACESLHSSCVFC